MRAALIDLHSHSDKRQRGAKVVYNVIIPPEGCMALEKGSFEDWISVGIHPWFINDTNTKAQLAKLKEVAGSANVKLIGECGLDRLRGPSLELQQLVLEEQINIAENARKPLLIHCVRCFNELILIKRRLNPSVPLIVHGFNNNEDILKQLLLHGFYLSFGAALLNNRSNAFKLLNTVPDDRFFLETDDKDIPVKKIYKVAAEIKNIPVYTLKDIIFANCMSLVEGV
ncbi:TatD family hydrolase [Desertivirga xinjiangensis]|uniref:TatD family hydrolase n=1 Tax=Desertivirga xinjiangensis TaxID=539206 RepID=UPI0021089991|nr:TatD family hydrolase [Pedobacter xinjiangensis]